MENQHLENIQSRDRNVYINNYNIWLIIEAQILSSTNNSTLSRIGFSWLEFGSQFLNIQSGKMLVRTSVWAVASPDFKGNPFKRYQRTSSPLCKNRLTVMSI